MDKKTMIALANMKFKLAKMQADKDAAQDKAAKDAAEAQA
jgi:hypothetical protein